MEVQVELPVIALHEAEHDSPELRQKMGYYEATREKYGERAEELRKEIAHYKEKTIAAMDAQAACFKLMKQFENGITAPTPELISYGSHLVEIIDKVEAQRGTHVVHALNQLEEALAVYLDSEVAPLQKSCDDFNKASTSYYTNTQAILARRKLDSAMEENLEKERLTYYEKEVFYMNILLQSRLTLKMGFIQPIFNYIFGHLDFYRSSGRMVKEIHRQQGRVEGILTNSRKDLRHYNMEERAAALEAFKHRHSTYSLDQSTEKEGYLLLQVSKPLMTQWVSHYARIKVNSNVIELVPFEEALGVKSRFNLPFLSNKIEPLTIEVEMIDGLSDCECNRPFCFIVGNSDRKYMFQVVSQAEKDEWLALLGRIAANWRANQPKNSPKSDISVTDLSKGILLANDVITLLEEGTKMDLVGIYRVSGGVKKVAGLLADYLANPEAGLNELKLCSTVELTSVLKLYLRQIEPPLIHYDSCLPLIELLGPSVIRTENCIGPEEMNQVGVIMSMLIEYHEVIESKRSGSNRFSFENIDQLMNISHPLANSPLSPDNASITATRPPNITSPRLGRFAKRFATMTLSSPREPIPVDSTPIERYKGNDSPPPIIRSPEPFAAVAAFNAILKNSSRQDGSLSSQYANMGRYSFDPPRLSDFDGDPTLNNIQ
eukprot:Ihof_evm4s36 gene=Ihof_evmTU4s36